MTSGDAVEKKTRKVRSLPGRGAVLTEMTRDAEFWKQNAGIGTECNGSDMTPLAFPVVPPSRMHGDEGVR